jgi:hypothetical protein
MRSALDRECLVRVNSDLASSPQASPAMPRAFAIRALGLRGIYDASGARRAFTPAGWFWPKVRRALGARAPQPLS